MGALGSGLGTALGGGIGGIATGLATNAIFGDATDQASEMQDKLYPGTTPFERLSNGGGGAAAAGASASQADKQMQTQMNIAKIGAKAQTDVAKINAGVGTRGQNLQYGITNNPRLEKDLASLDAATKKSVSEQLLTIQKLATEAANTRSAEANAKLQEALSKLDHSWAQSQIAPSIQEIPGWIMGGAPDGIVDSIDKIKSKLDDYEWRPWKRNFWPHKQTGVTGTNTETPKKRGGSTGSW